jgi:hypothetical protein
MNLNQVIVKLRINNIMKSINSQIHSIELNIIDSSILRLIRSEVKQQHQLFIYQMKKYEKYLISHFKLKLEQSADETIMIPFNLTSDSEKETELFFNVSDCTFPHKVKGTMTYMMKVCYFIYKKY